MECVPTPEQTAHVSDERERERKRERERGKESRLDQRGRLPQLYYYFQKKCTQSACSETGSVSFSLSGRMVPPHHAILLHPLQRPAAASTSVRLPAHCHFIYSGSVGFLVCLATHFPDLVHWPSPQYTHWLKRLVNKAYFQIIQKKEETLIQIQTSILA